jgi:hypothetical protein
MRQQIRVNVGAYAGQFGMGPILGSALGSFEICLYTDSRLEGRRFGGCSGVACFCIMKTKSPFKMED